MQRLGLEALSLKYFDFVLPPRYREAAFAVTKRGILSPSECARLETTWAKRLSGSDRTVWHNNAPAVELE